MLRAMEGLVACALFAGLVGAPAALEAQDYERQVRGYLNHYVDENFGGWEDVYTTTTGSLDEDQYQDIFVDLVRGNEYVAVGACDEDCSDADIYIYNPSGDKVAQDEASDDFPWVKFVAGRSGRYSVRMLMYSCGAEPCYYAMRILK